MPSLTLPLPAVLAALALTALVSAAVAAVRFDGRRIVGLRIADRRMAPEPVQRSVVVRVEHVTRSASSLGSAPVIPLRPLDSSSEHGTTGGDRP